MRLIIDPTLKGKELFEYLIKNKKAIISKKKSLPHNSDAVSFSYTILTPEKNTVKSDGATTVLGKDTVNVLTISNTSMYCDSQMDVLLPDAAKRSINNNKDLIYHLHDHEHEVDAIVGDVNEITLPYLKWSDLGVNFPGTTQVILFNTDIKKDYNKKVFNLYRKKKIKQHSIGLQYVSLEMALNDPDYKDEFALYNKYINLIPNKDFIEKRGFYFVVPEIKLLENSCVLWGANSLTGTLETSNHSIDENDIEDKETFTIDKDAGTYSDSENQGALMFIDQMSKRHKKSMNMIDDCMGDDNIDNDDLMAECDSMKAAHQTSINNLQAIKESILSGKSSPNPDTSKTAPSIVITEFDTLKAIREFKFLN